ncbi:hypothetical protein AAFF_G00274930 [Aldrovandia affinis]|uniref:Uncharacterized protein n=1 Tax=Aldrovandia affinis TaxID=143900 RepID=A0AAD7WSC8_9TELE|nr:hypothetical protein AAFF_G00274930 [Aldrovandia affinis]
MAHEALSKTMELGPTAVRIVSLRAAVPVGREMDSITALAALARRDAAQAECNLATLPAGGPREGGWAGHAQGQ